jgi:Protein of unknown function (DUF1800)
MIRGLRCSFILALVALASIRSADAAGIAISQLGGLDGNGQCLVRPTVGAPIYGAIVAARSNSGLSDAKVLQHAATRLGFGLSPFGPLRPDAANDCTTVFVADELANQIAGLGARSDSAQLLRIRRGILPLTMFTRSVLNQSINRLQQDPQGVALGAHLTTRYEARTQHIGLKTLRELFGSQIVQGATIVDVQLNLDQIMSEFWLNHFNVNIDKSNQYYFGSNAFPEAVYPAQGTTFESLLIAVMREPAMLMFLDNKDNRCDPVTGVASNQNLARELLELHTLGVPPTTGVYDQDDVEAMASVLCGWNAIPFSTVVPTTASGFVFNAALASSKSVNVLGVTYPATGEARVTSVLRALSAHAATVTNVCSKLSDQFYAPALASAARDACSASWGTGGNLKAILRSLVSRTDFWRSSNYRSLQRTPIELVVAIARQQGANVLDLATATAAAGLTETPFAPATITPQQVADRTTALRAQRPFQFMTSLLWRIRIMLGVPRGMVASPAGYPMDGAVFISGAYLEDASRLGLEVASSFGYLLDPDRNDLTSKVNRDALTAKLASGSPDAAQEWFLETRMAMGGVMAGGSTAPFVFSPSHTSILRSVFASAVYWAYWSTATATKLGPQTLVGLALGNSQALWR